ncbi:YihY/virulence factor BrkB family protein [Krasilnikovia sp. M28-CT-15]|uniref:YihY/virulence factor BrkB family protein n=1 Tax=Krasilnikovia sp. M28-CT-15 TaxID=3373540 RepID=UPI003875BE7A
MSGVLGRVDRLQQRNGVLGFGYAVVRKYLDDGGGREAALITYYGFLSIFPVLLLGVTVVSRVLVARPDLRHRLISAFVPSSLQSSVESAAAAMPTSAVPLTIGIIGLLFSGTGVVFSAYHTLNHVAAVPHRLRHGIVSWLLRVLVVLVVVLAGVVAVGALTVAVTVVPGLSAVPQAAGVVGSWLIGYGVLLLAARVLLSRPAPVRALWPGAALGATALTLVLTVGAAVLPGLVRRAGAVYGSFAAVAGMFSLLYVLSLALVFSAEVAAVREGRLWPRALDRDHPTAADARALALMAREQERDPADRIQVRDGADSDAPFDVI